MSRLLIARLALTALVLGLVAACDALTPAAPSVSLNVTPGQSIEPGQVITVTAEGSVSPIDQLALHLDGALIGSLSIERDERALGRQHLSVELPAALPSGRLELRGSARDALGRDTQLTIEVTHGEVRTPRSLAWLEPSPSAVLRGDAPVALRVEVSGAEAPAEVRVMLLASDDSAVLFGTLASLGDGVFAGQSTLTPNSLTPGAYRLWAQARDASGALLGSSDELSISVAAAAPSVRFTQQQAFLTRGVLEYELEFSAAYGVADVAVALVAPGGERTTLLPVVDVAAGRAVGVVPLLPPPAGFGRYELAARVVDATGAESLEARSEFVAVEPFALTNPTAGNDVGAGAERQLVSVSISRQGSWADAVTIDAVEVFINAAPVGAATLVTDGSSTVAVFAWDTNTPIAGAHDPDISGDREIIAKVTYTYGDGEDLVTLERLTPAVLVTHNPATP